MVAAEITKRFPQIVTEIINLDDPCAIKPENVFAVPTYVLDEEVLSLGNPHREQIIAKVTAALSDEREEPETASGRPILEGLLTLAPNRSVAEEEKRFSSEQEGDRRLAAPTASLAMLAGACQHLIASEREDLSAQMEEIR